MDETTIGLALVSLVALILPVMALVGRRIPVSRLAAMAGMWIAIFAVGYLIVRWIGQ